LFLLGFIVKNYPEQTVNLQRTPCGDVKMESDVFEARIEAQAALIAELVEALKPFACDCTETCLYNHFGYPRRADTCTRHDVAPALAKAKAVQP
jgi:hypothetical protein